MPAPSTTTTTHNQPSTLHTQQQRYGTVDEWVRITGISRSETYRRIKSGDLIARKLGRSTILDFTAGFAFIQSLPPA